MWCEVYTCKGYDKGQWYTLIAYLLIIIHQKRCIFNSLLKEYSSKNKIYYLPFVLFIPFPTGALTAFTTGLLFMFILAGNHHILGSFLGTKIKKKISTTPNLINNDAEVMVIYYLYCIGHLLIYN